MSGTYDFGEEIEDTFMEKTFDLPNGFECSITGELMKDPVIAADGFSYERKAIETWFSQGKETSPQTNQKLSHLTLIPNHDLRKAIQDFRAKRAAYEPLFASQKPKNRMNKLLETGSCSNNTCLIS